MHKKNLLKLLGLSMLVAASVMAVSASAAQAKYLLLLNGQSVSSLTLTLEGLSGHMTAENGLEVECEGGTGTATGELAGGGTEVVGSATATFEGCVWVGSEGTCTINDGGEGLIHASGEGEVVMPDASTYKVVASDPEFTTILTEGIFCTIPEEEVVSGTGSVEILNALEDTKVKLGHLNADDLKLGNSHVTELTGEVHITDENPNATFGIHLVEL